MKNLQKTTESDTIDTINQQTGLTPLQEQTVILLLSGKNISTVSNTLNIDRSTIYQWQQKENFQAFYNNLQQKIKFETESGIMGMYDEAIEAIRNCLTSNNDSVRLKAAVWLIEVIKSKDVGNTNPWSLIKQNCMQSNLDIDFGYSLNENKYRNRLKENNLK